MNDVYERMVQNLHKQRDELANSLRDVMAQNTNLTRKMEEKDRALEVANEISRDHIRLVTQLAGCREALEGLIGAVEIEVNEKGAGGFLLARLTDAKAALNSGKEGE